MMFRIAFDTLDLDLWQYLPLTPSRIYILQGAHLDAGYCGFIIVIIPSGKDAIWRRPPMLTARAVSFLDDQAR